MAITLRNRDRDILIEIFAQVVEYKSQTLKPMSWSRFEQDWMPPAIEQLRVNSFQLNHPDKNFFMWLIDQICHSHRLQIGVRPQDGLPLCDTHLGQEAIEICRRAARGQAYYDQSRGNNFSSLFEIL
jgi:hypothetical protein